MPKTVADLAGNKVTIINICPRAKKIVRPNLLSIQNWSISPGNFESSRDKFKWKRKALANFDVNTLNELVLETSGNQLPEILLDIGQEVLILSPTQIVPIDSISYIIKGRLNDDENSYFKIKVLAGNKLEINLDPNIQFSRNENGDCHIAELKNMELKCGTK